MNRREFLGVLGGVVAAAAVWRIPRIGHTCGPCGDNIYVEPQIFAPHDAVLVTRTGEVFLVTAVAGAKTTVIRAIGGPFCSLENGDELVLIGNAKPEISHPSTGWMQSKLYPTRSRLTCYEK